MTPGDIGPHPDAPEHYWPMKKPASMTDDECGTLTIRRVGVTVDMVQETPVRIVNAAQDGVSFYPGFLSEWYPSPEDVIALMGGAPLRMLIVGDGLPPANLWVRGEGEV